MVVKGELIVSLIKNVRLGHRWPEFEQLSLFMIKLNQQVLVELLFDT